MNDSVVATPLTGTLKPEAPWMTTASDVRPISHRHPGSSKLLAVMCSTQLPLGLTPSNRYSDQSAPGSSSPATALTSSLVVCMASLDWDDHTLLDNGDRMPSVDRRGTDAPRLTARMVTLLS